MVTPNLYLINDDQPTQFAGRKLVLISGDIRVAGKHGVVVQLDPTLDDAAGGPLTFAVLVPRHKDTVLSDVFSGVLPKRASVFVCRFKGTPQDLGSDLRQDEVEIVFWGRVVGKLA